MAKTDDYQQSFDLAARELAGRDPARVAELAGASLAADGSAWELDYYGRPLRVSREPFAVATRDAGPPLPLPEQALVLHYLARARGVPLKGEWITFREVESGEFYWSAFVKRAKNPLLTLAGENPGLLASLAPVVGGEPAKEVAGDAALVVWAFPRVPILLQVFAGDEEFPADANLLFDRTVGNYLCTEDVALAAGLPVYKMMAARREYLGQAQKAGPQA